MANRWLQQFVFGYIKKRTDVVGSFAPAGTGAVTDVKGNGFTVARTGVGVFTVTLADSFYAFIGGKVTLQLATADDKFVQLGTYDAANKTLVINAWDISGAALTDIAANANNRIHFHLVFSNSSVSV